MLEATVRLLAAEGLARMTMDRVAAEAGVSKVTVYTRWRSRSELLAAALQHLQVDHVPPSTGVLREDLVAHLDAMRRQHDDVGGMAVVGNCLADEPVSGELLATIRRSTLLPRRAGIAAVVRAGVERGDLDPTVDVERLVSTLVGNLYADHLAGRDLDDAWAADVVDAVLPGFLPRS